MATDTSNEPTSSLQDILLDLPQEELDVLGAGSTPEGEQTAEETEPAETEETEEEESGEEEDSGAPSIFDLADQHGVDLRTKYRTEEAALVGLMNAQKLVGQRNDMAKWGEAIRDNPEEVFNILAQHLGKTPEQKPAKPAAEAKTVTSDDPEVSAYLKLKESEPAWDEDWENQVTYDDKGQMVPTPDAEPGVVRKIKAHQTWERKIAAYVLRKPEVIVKATGGAPTKADEELKELRAKMAQMEQASALQENQRFLLEIAAQNKDWMFNGGEIRQGNLSPAGSLFAQTFDTLLAQNPNTKNPRLLADAARAMVASHLQAQQAVAKKKPNQKTAEETEETEEREPRSFREKLRTAQHGKTRTPSLSASVRDKGAGKRAWPTVNGRELSLEERMLQIIGKK